MTERMSPLAALKELGFDLRRPSRGTVLVDTGRYAPHQFKHYAFRHRAGDGHVHCRLGRLISAYRQAGSGLIIFEVDGMSQ